jgi:hypothetical protein
MAHFLFSGSDDVALALKNCDEVPWLSLYL